MSSIFKKLNKYCYLPDEIIVKYETKQSIAIMLGLTTVQKINTELKPDFFIPGSSWAKLKERSPSEITMVQKHICEY